MAKKKENPYAQIEYAVNMLNKVVNDKGDASKEDRSLDAVQSLYVEILGMRYLPLWFCANYKEDEPTYVATVKVICIATGDESQLPISYKFLGDYFMKIAKLYGDDILR